MADGSANEPALDNWLRQRGKALYTADGKLGSDADDMIEWFQLWDDFRDAGLHRLGRRPGARRRPRHRNHDDHARQGGDRSSPTRTS